MPLSRQHQQTLRLFEAKRRAQQAHREARREPERLEVVQAAAGQTSLIGNPLRLAAGQVAAIDFGRRVLLPVATATLQLIANH